MTIGRPREFETEEALEAAMNLFWRKGYETSSLDELLQTMSLSKSSFYSTFGSKHELFQKCITHYRKMLEDRLLENLEQEKSGRQFIENLFFDLTKKEFRQKDLKGCLIMNSANEFAQKDLPVSTLVSKGVSNLVEILLKAIKQAQNEGNVSKNKNPRSLARYLLTNICGLQTMLKAGIKQTEAKEIIRETLKALD